MADLKRPRGVKVIAVFLFVCAVPALFMALLAGISGPPDKTITDSLMRCFFILSPVLFFISALGLWRAHKIGKYLSLVTSSAMLIYACFGIYSVVSEPSSNRGDTLFSFIILFFLTAPFIAIIIYLINGNLKPKP